MNCNTLVEYSLVRVLISNEFRCYMLSVILIHLMNDPSFDLLNGVLARRSAFPCVAHVILCVLFNDSTANTSIQKGVTSQLDREVKLGS
jgi:hypothetical protein